MKKYLAAGAVAIMVFAFAAMAASLDVDGGTLEAGIDTDLDCFDSAIVTYDTGYDQGSNAPTDEPFHVTAINVELTNPNPADCVTSDLRGHLKVNDGGDNATGSGSNIGPHGYAIVPILGGPVNGYSFSVNVAGSSLLVEELHQVQVMVKTAAGTGEENGYDGGTNSVFYGVN